MNHIATIDIGNTRTKVVIFNEEGGVVSSFIDPHLASVLKEFEPIKCVYSSVRKMDEVVTEKNIFQLLQQWGAIAFGPQLCGILDIGIQEVETLGRDRLAGIMGARYLFGDKQCLVIDAGTCITYDYLTEGNFYGGGSISMGLEMRYQALNHFTQKLPKLGALDMDANAMIGKDIGDRTSMAIHSGVLGGLFDELNARTDRFISNFANSAIILTGGDANFLVKHIKNEIFVEPLLVHYGLYYALHSV